jgi:hypothetical protein
MKDLANKFNQLKSQVSEFAKDAGALIGQRADIVNNFVKGTHLKSLFSVSTSADSVSDTTHYFLLPSPYTANDYVLHTHRDVPEYIDEKSTVEFKRILHVPTEKHIDTLKRLVHEDMCKNALTNINSESSTAITLEQMASQIDTSNEKVTNGLMVAGVVACFVNPVTGIAIIGSSFLPNFASEFISSSFKSIAQKLKRTSMDRADQRAQETARKQMQHVPVEIRPNIVLFKIYKCVSDKDYDALADVRDDALSLRLTLPIIRANYNLVGDWSFFSGNKINDNLKNYLMFLFS